MKKFYESLMLRDFTKIMLMFSTDIINNFFKIKKTQLQYYYMKTIFKIYGLY